MSASRSVQSSMTPPTMPSAIADLHLDDLLALRYAALTTQATNQHAVGTTHGPFVSRHRGHGLDFDDLRQYTAGDDVRHIDWKVTARHSKTMTRLFREERDSTVTIAVDFRHSMHTGTDTLRAVTAGRLAAAYAWHATQRGQRVAPLILTNSQIYSEQPMAGDAGALRVCRTLVEAFAISSSAARSANDNNPSLTSLQPLFDALILGGRKTGSSIVITGFDDAFDNALIETLKNGLSELQAKHRSHAHALCMVQVLDTAESQSLPAGRYGYRALLNAQITSKKRFTVRKLQASQRTALEQHLQEQTRLVETLCRDHSIECTNHLGPSTEQSIANTISQLTQHGVLA